MWSWKGLKKERSVAVLKVPTSITAVPGQGLASRPVDCPVRITVGPPVGSFPPELASRGQKPQLDFRGEAATSGDFGVCFQKSFHLGVQKAFSSSPGAVAPGKQGRTAASCSFRKDTPAVRGQQCKCSPAWAPSHQSSSRPQVCQRCCG